MKSIIAAALTLLCFNTYAQKEKTSRHKNQEKIELTQEQKKALQLKEMTLKLELTDKQQKEMSTLIDEQHKAREAEKVKRDALKAKNEKPTADEIFQMKSERLDRQIAFQNKAKKILNEEQFKKFKMHDNKKRHEFRSEGKRFERKHKRD